MKVRLINGRFVCECSYDERYTAKSARFQWDPAKKQWWTMDWERAAALLSVCDDDARAVIEAEQRKAGKSIDQSRATEIADASIEIPAPAGLEYLPFQRAGIAYALGRPTTLIGDEMGLGKTIQAIGIINTDPAINRVLVVCPASLRINWYRELKKWLVRPLYVGIVDRGLPNTHVVIINYDILKKHEAALRAVQWDLLIADECHYVKNPKAIRTQQLLGNAKKGVSPIPARRRVYMTGTPIVNRPIELWPILQSTGQWTSWFQFATRYCAAHQTRFGWDVSGATNLEELQNKLRSTIMVRRLKKDVLTELPAKRRQVIVLPCEDAAAAVQHEMSAWQSHKERLLQLQSAVELAKASEDPEDYAAAVMAMRSEISVAFSEMSLLRHETALAKVPYVVDHAAEVVDSVGCLVVFAHHKDVVAKIRSGLEEKGIKTVILTGDMAASDRQASVDAFQAGKAQVFIGTIMAAGVGLTLTAAAHVVFAELDWVPGNVSQAEDRLHRIGQTGNVLVQHLVLEDSLDAHMAQTIVEKQDVIDRALDRDAGELKIPTIPMHDMATRTLTRKAIEKEAEQIDPAEIPGLHAKLRLLSSWCDGAQARDGMGFSKIDAGIGHSLARADHLSPKMAVIARRLVTKYRRQFAAEGVA